MTKEITFIGPAGVGKKTQLILLKKYLEQQGKKTSHRYVKCFHPRILGLVARLSGRGTDSTTIDVALAKGVMRLVYSLDLFLVLGLYFYGVKLDLLMGKFVLIEESLLGSITEFMDSERKHFISKTTESRISSFLFRFVNNEKPIVVALLADLPTLHKRMAKRGFRLEKDPYLLFQINAIKDIVRRLGKDNTILVTDQEKDITEIHQLIMSRLPTRLLTKQ